MRSRIRIAILLLACSLSARVDAAPPLADVIPQFTALTVFDLDRLEARALFGHPNEYWRYRGLRALKIDQPSRALANFELAAGYADKYSQHVISLMYWHGLGVDVDRATAYAWSDLAAERGYRELLILRERMWTQLDAAERERALRAGEALYARHGDRQAKPRLERELRKALANSTGSRLGSQKDRIKFVGNADVPWDLYDDDYWRPDTYWRGEDRTWRESQGSVNVLPLEQLPAPETVRPEPARPIDPP